MHKKMKPYWFSVIDRKTKKIICNGPATQWKYIKGYSFVSVDGIHFFKETYDGKLVGGGDKFQVVKNLITDQIIPLEYIPKHYNLVPWGKRWKDQKYNIRCADVSKFKDDDNLLIDVSMIDVYVEAPIDKECLPLVNALNTIDGIETVTSCCGHGNNYFVISFYCYNVSALIKIYDSISNKKNIVISIGSEENSDYIVYENKLLFTLQINAIGPEAYKIADEYANELLKNNT